MMNYRDTPSSRCWRRNNYSSVTEHTTSRRRHLAAQRFEEQRTRADNPPINALDVLKSHEDKIEFISKDEDMNETTLFIDVRKKLNEAALSEAMSGPGRSNRKQQSNIILQGIPITSLPRYGRRSLRLKQLRENEKAELALQQPHTQILQSKTVSAPEVSNPSVDISLDVKLPASSSVVPLAEPLNPASSESTVHTVPTSDDELSCDEVSRRAYVEVTKQKEQYHHFEAVAADETNICSKLKLECEQRGDVNEIESLRTTIAALKLNQKHYEDELEAATMEKKRADAYIEEAAETKKAQDEEISKLKDFLLSAEKDLISKGKMMVDLQIKLQSNDAGKKEMMSKIKSQEVQVQELQFHYNKCVSEARDKDDELSRIKDRAVEDTSKISALQTHVNHLERDFRECKEENKELINQLTAVILELQKNICDKDNNIDRLSSDLDTARSDSRNLKSKVDASSAELMLLKNWKINAEKLLDEKENKLEETKSNLEAKLEECNALISVKDSEIARMQNIAEKKEEEIKSLNEANSSAEKSLVEKDAIISKLRSNTSRLEAELEECKDFYVKKLAFAQAPTLGISQQMERNLRTKEVELELLKVELERGKVECSKLRSVVAQMTSDSEVSDLKAWKKNAQERMRKQHQEHKKFVEDKIDCISTLQQRLQASECEANKRYEVELSKICRERDELKSEVESRKVEINEIAIERNEFMHEMNSLRVWKEEAISNLAMKEREVSVLEVATRRNLDVENELKRQTAKYNEAKEALHDMEKALRAVALERKRI